jgi:DNA helicase HerA-like ATPase
MTRPRDEYAHLSTPVARQAALTVGTVESVSPGRISVQLELDAPQTTALNTGSPVAFPRLNGFVVIPNETGALVGIVTWVGVEHSAYPKRPGLSDFGLVDLPFPLRKMRVIPVGTLERSGEGVKLIRGVRVFPSVGDPVALPSAEQLGALTRGEKEDRRVHIGRALLGNDAEVRVDPDKMFGRHLAVLGNTGSGKSCTVAGLIRWSIEAARESRSDGNDVNCRFIVLDPNGEYRDAFSDLSECSVYQVPPVEDSGASELRLPAWLLNSREWASITLASDRAQRPVLTRALRNLRLGLIASVDDERAFAGLIAEYKVAVMDAISLGPKSWAQDYGGRMSIGSLIETLERTLEVQDTDGKPWADAATDLGEWLEELSELRDGRGNWKGFDRTQLDGLVDRLDALSGVLPEPSTFAMGNEDSPRQFNADLLADQVDMVIASAEFQESARYVGGLKTRIRSLMADERIRPILRPDAEPTLAEWLEEILGSKSAGHLAVIDLSLVPSDVVEITVGVLARVIFETLQRHRRLNAVSLPTALVLDEAHTFVGRYRADAEYATPRDMCVRTFERIAREGRKFGLGLVLASQRPSELSPTVLAQCNSFLLHRLVNDHDQDLVSKLVPDNLSGLLEDLPSLPAQHAMLLGWAAPLPTLMEVRELPKDHLPRSDDPDFWDVWTGVRDAKVNWAEIAKIWAGNEAGESLAIDDAVSASPSEGDPSAEAGTVTEIETTED